MIQLPVNQILQLVFKSDFQGGLKLHAELKNPAPEDDRWAGYCLLELGRAWHARDLLTEAMDRGYQAAAIELALTHHRLGETEMGLSVLNGLNLNQLSAFDRAQASRCLGNIHLMVGDHSRALIEFEKAWTIAIKGEASKPIRAGIAHQLGYVNIQSGKLDQAFHHLEYSLNHALPSRRIYPLLSRAHAYTNAGRFKEAQSDLLEARDLLRLTPGMASTFTYRLGMLRQMQGLWSEALDLHLETARLAKSRGERALLERSLLNTALKTMDRWQASGKSQQCLEMARRLLELEPLNPDLIEHVLNSVLVLDGPAAARRELALFTKVFQEELGELPPQLLRIDQVLRSKMN